MRRINILGNNSYCSNTISTAKYNIFTFFPLSIMIQFASFFNIFFLFSAIMLSIPQLSPLNPLTTITPVVIVISFGIIREGIQDYKRHKYDKTYNNHTSLKYCDEKKNFIKEKWKNLSVGSIIKIKNNEILPADILVIKSYSSNGFFYLQTTNLDGETGLKPKEAINIITLNDDDIIDFKGYLEVDNPNDDIYKINGKIIIDTKFESFSIKNIGLRGSNLKNVEYIIGIIIYSGNDTKLMKNIKIDNIKRSSIETKLNFIVIIIMILTFILCLISTIFGVIFENNHVDHIYIFNQITENNFLRKIKIFVSFFAIFTTLIPLSIVITMEIIKGIQITKLGFDKDMYVKENEKFRVLSLNLQEDLGNVKYIFTDKTGTLTKNEMEFKACSIFTYLFDNTSKDISHNYISYSDDFDVEYLRNCFIENERIKLLDIGNSKYNFKHEVILEFFINLAVNHDVVSEIKNDTILYQGPSPDECILVKAAQEIGIEFIEKSNNSINLLIFNEKYSFLLLHKFEYSSIRMRSSIILRDQNNKIKLYIKGADYVIIKKIDQYSKNFLLNETKNHIEKFAKSGLRTLCFGVKEIDENEYKIWENKYISLKMRDINCLNYESDINECINEIEENITLLGVSALEDKLQEEVPQTLNSFIEAGIEVLMLTGDKLDTAEAIGYSCNLFKDDTEVFKIKCELSNDEIFLKINSILIEMKKIEDDFKKINNLKKSRILSSKQVRKNNTILSPIKNINFGNIIEERKVLQRKYSILTQNMKNNLSNKNLEFISEKNKNDEENINDQSILEGFIKEGFFNEEIEIENISLFNNITFNKKENNKKTKFLNKNNNKKKISNVNSYIDFYKKKINAIENEKSTIFDLNWLNKNREVNDNSDMGNFSLIIEGSAITKCLSEKNSEVFWQIIKKSRSVVCCRSSPTQKSDIVEFIKKKSNKVTLSIGDGGNDVNMIKSANIGVGIFGKEGSQAAFSSDYAISQFKYLHKLILIHGRYLLMRNSYFVLYYFYKNMIFTLPQFWFAFSNGFSGNLLWDDFYYLAYNSFITVIPVCSRMLFEEDIDINFKGYPNNHKSKLLIPSIYKEYRQSYPFTIIKFFITLLIGIFHSLIVYILPEIIYKNNTIFILDGKSIDLWNLSFTSYITMIIVQLIIIYEHTYFLNLSVILGIFLQFLLSSSFFLINNYFLSSDLSGRLFDQLQSFIFWLTIIITSIITVLPVLIFRRFQNIFSKNIITSLRINKSQFDLLKREYEKKLEGVSVYTRSLQKFKKLYNLLLESDYEPDTYADKKMKDFIVKQISNRKRKKKLRALSSEGNKMIIINKNTNTDNMKEKENINFELKNDNLSLYSNSESDNKMKKNINILRNFSIESNKKLIEDTIERDKVENNKSNNDFQYEQYENKSNIREKYKNNETILEESTIIDKESGKGFIFDNNKLNEIVNELALDDLDELNQMNNSDINDNKMNINLK